MSHAATIHTGSPAWVDRLMTLFPTTYIGDHGMMITNMNSDGSADIAEPVVADFGDILPFLWHFGMHEFSTEQIEKTHGWCEQGLYVSDGRTRLFFNHDWLLGLIDLYRQSGQAQLLKMAEQGATTIGERYFCGDLLVDELVRGSGLRSWFAPASPFNGGYIELWVDLYRFTGEDRYLGYAERLASGWTRTRDFREHGVFCRKLSARSEWLNRLVMSRSRLRARLFKDNTNLVWGILVLYQQTKDQRWADAISRWLDGFAATFYRDGEVALMLDMDWQPYNTSLKAGFSSLDLMCDLHDEGIEQERVLQMARKIAAYWLNQQWDNGLFPELPGGDEDHLDANVDIVVGLAKLYAITGERRYLNALDRCRRAILDLHDTPVGYCQSVDAEGRAVDDKIKIKYQGLIFKLALLPEDPADLFQQDELLELLRDR